MFYNSKYNYISHKRKFSELRIFINPIQFCSSRTQGIFRFEDVKDDSQPISVKEVLALCSWLSFIFILPWVRLYLCLDISDHSCLIIFYFSNFPQRRFIESSKFFFLSLIDLRKGEIMQPWFVFVQIILYYCFDLSS